MGYVKLIWAYILHGLKIVKYIWDPHGFLTLNPYGWASNVGPSWVSDGKCVHWFKMVAHAYVRILLLWRAWESVIWIKEDLFQTSPSQIAHNPGSSESQIVKRISKESMNITLFYNLQTAPMGYHSLMNHPNFNIFGTTSVYHFCYPYVQSDVLYPSFLTLSVFSLG